MIPSESENSVGGALRKWGSVIGQKLGNMTSGPEFVTSLEEKGRLSAVSKVLTTCQACSRGFACMISLTLKNTFEVPIILKMESSNLSRNYETSYIIKA